MFERWEIYMALAFAIPWAVLTLFDHYYTKRLNHNLRRRQANVNENTRRRG